MSFSFLFFLLIALAQYTERETILNFQTRKEGERKPCRKKRKERNSFFLTIARRRVGRGRRVLLRRPGLVRSRALVVLGEHGRLPPGRGRGPGLVQRGLGASDEAPEAGGRDLLKGRRKKRRRRRACESAPLPPVFDGGDGSFLPSILSLFLGLPRRRELYRGHPGVEGRERVAAGEVRLALEHEGRDGFFSSSSSSRRRRRSERRTAGDGRAGGGGDRRRRLANARCCRLFLHPRCRRARSERGQ